MVQGAESAWTVLKYNEYIKLSCIYHYKGGTGIYWAINSILGWLYWNWVTLIPPLHTIKTGEPRNNHQLNKSYKSAIFLIPPVGWVRLRILPNGSSYSKGPLDKPKSRSNVFWPRKLRQRTRWGTATAGRPTTTTTAIGSDQEKINEWEYVPSLESTFNMCYHRLKHIFEL